MTGKEEIATINIQSRNENQAKRVSKKKALELPKSYNFVQNQKPKKIIAKKQ